MLVEPVALTDGLLALWAGESQILDRSKGNPGAINVMLVGVQTYGLPFLSRLEHHGVDGAAVWTLFKDKADAKLHRMAKLLSQEGPIQ